jgi:hypothetical protein
LNRKLKAENAGSGKMSIFSKHTYLRYAMSAVIALLIIASLSFLISSKDENDFNPRIDAWYKVEPWEVEVCSKWGGGTEAQSYSGSGITTKSIVSGSETVTLQAQRTSYKLSSNTTTYLYEASWYYQPMVGTDSYKVYFVKGTDKEMIYEESTSAQMGDGNYHAVQFNTDPGYDSVLLEYGSGKKLSVKIQKKDVSVI